MLAREWSYAKNLGHVRYRIEIKIYVFGKRNDTRGFMQIRLVEMN